MCLCLSFTIMSFPCRFIFKIRLLWDCMMLDANSYPEVAFSRKEPYLASGYSAKMSICVTQCISMRM